MHVVATSRDHSLFVSYFRRSRKVRSRGYLVEVRRTSLDERQNATFVAGPFKTIALAALLNPRVANAVRTTWESEPSVGLPVTAAVP